MSNQNKIAILTGPTAVGKTEISIKIAQMIPNIEIISADSMQIYKYMDIGTDKPEMSILKRYKHHCINLIEPWESFNVKQYSEQAEKCISDILNRNKKPLVVGGTGLYIKSLITPIFQGPGQNKKIRDELYELIQEKGNAFLYNKLQKFDLEYSKKISINDSRRLVRALEVFYLTGKSITYFHQEDKIKKNYSYFIICIHRNREALYKKIDERVEKIIAQGLIEEIEVLRQRYDKLEEFNSMQGLGYKQILLYLQGNISKEEAIEMIKKKTRNFAKRQLSWFKNQIKVDYWINLDEYSDLNDCVEIILDIMRREGY
jgi:tRNA dimethylallyltransferase